MKTLMNKAQIKEWLAVNRKLTLLTVKYARDVRLFDGNGTELARAGGHGYDRLGVLLATFLKAEFSDKLATLAKSKHLKSFYGLRVLKNGEWRLDGACGDSCMASIAAAIGLHFDVFHFDDQTTLIKVGALPNDHFLTNEIKRVK